MPTAAYRSVAGLCTMDCAKATPKLPPVRNSGTNIALTPPTASENIVAANLNDAENHQLARSCAPCAEFRGTAS